MRGFMARSHGRALSGLLLVALVVACGRTGLFVLSRADVEEAGTEAGTLDAVSEPTTSASDVSGQVIVHYATDTGVEDRNVDLTGVTIEAFAEVSLGDFARITGIGRSDGSFLVRDVPVGSFLLRIGTTVFVHPARQLVLPIYRAGRANATPVVGNTVTLNVDGLSPWQPALLFELVISSSNAGCEEGVSPIPGPQIGSTSIQGAIAPILLCATVDAMQGDRASLIQYTQRTDSSGASYTQLSRILDVPSPELGVQLSSVVQGTMRPVVPDQQVTANLDLPAFEAYFPELAPAAKHSTFFVDVAAYAHPPPPALAPSLPFLEHQRLPVVEDRLLALGVGAGVVGAFPLTFASPFPGWTTWVETSYTVEATWTIGGADGGTGLPLYGQFYRLAPLPSLDHGPVTPMLTPPRDIRIDGADAFAGAGHVNPSPTFTWTAATSLDPDFSGGTIRYELDLEPVGDPTGFTFVTVEPQVTVPPQLLKAGATYVAHLDARAVAAPDLANPAFDYVAVSTAPFWR
jgi:hypothetical protein